MSDAPDSSPTLRGGTADAAYRVLYEDGASGIELGRDEQGAAFDVAMRLFSERRAERGRVRVFATYMVQRTLLDLQWSVEGLELQE